MPGQVASCREFEVREFGVREFGICEFERALSNVAELFKVFYLAQKLCIEGLRTWNIQALFQAFLSVEEGEPVRVQFSADAVVLLDAGTGGIGEQGFLVLDFSLEAAPVSFAAAAIVQAFEGALKTLKFLGLGGVFVGTGESADFVAGGVVNMIELAGEVVGLFLGFGLEACVGMGGKAFLEVGFDLFGGEGGEQVENGVIGEAELAGQGFELMDMEVGDGVFPAVVEIRDGEGVAFFIDAPAAGPAGHLEEFMVFEGAEGMSVVFAQGIEANGPDGVVDTDAEGFGAVEHGDDAGLEEGFDEELLAGQHTGVVVGDAFGAGGVQLAGGGGPLGFGA